MVVTSGKGIKRRVFSRKQPLLYHNTNKIVIFFTHKKRRPAAVLSGVLTTIP